MKTTPTLEYDEEGKLILWESKLWVVRIDVDEKLKELLEKVEDIEKRKQDQVRE